MSPYQQATAFPRTWLQAITGSENIFPTLVKELNSYPHLSWPQGKKKNPPTLDPWLLLALARRFLVLDKELSSYPYTRASGKALRQPRSQQLSPETRGYEFLLAYLFIYCNYVSEYLTPSMCVNPKCIWWL